MKVFSVILISACILIGCKANLHHKKITIFAAGDSTMATKIEPDKNPEHGWVQVLPQYFTTEVEIVNAAVNGRSSKSFRDKGNWKTVYENLKPGDFVLIQFGHNDAKETDPERYTNPQTEYRYNLMRYIEEVKSKGAHPIILSSIARRKFNKEGVLLDAHGNYTLIARLVADEMKVPFIDMQYLTENLEKSYGVENSKKLHLHFQKGENAYFPDGKIDDTHLSELGANEVAKLFVAELKRKKLALAKYVK